MNENGTTRKCKKVRTIMIGKVYLMHKHKL